MMRGHQFYVGNRCIGFYKDGFAFFGTTPFFVENSGLGIDLETLEDMKNLNISYYIFRYEDSHGTVRIWKCPANYYNMGNKISYKPGIYSENVKSNQVLVSAFDMEQIEGPPLKNAPKIKNIKKEKDLDKDKGQMRLF